MRHIYLLLSVLIASFNLQAQLSLQGIIDFDLPSSAGKAIHVTVTGAIADLSTWGIGVANNGGGTDGQEYTFPMAAPAIGDDILVVRDSQAMADYFDACFSEFEHVFIDATGSISQNGDDAIELFNNGAVVETFGDVNVDGTGEPWEYTDSWAYKDATGNWTYGGPNCTDGSTTTASSSCPYPLCVQAPPATNDITFQIDLSSYAGSFTTAYVNGDFNGWCGACNAMSDANGDGIWEVTLPLTQDSIEYKFTLDGWNVQENLTQGDPCTKTTAGFTNRFLVIDADTTLPVVCWESCGPCSAVVTKNVTFQVDLSQYAGSFTTAYVNGDFNGWCGTCNAMTDANGDGIWEATLPLTQDSIEYKFTLDGWNVQENFTPGDPCTKTTGGFTNRFIQLTGDTTIPVVCWEQCGPCMAMPNALQLQGVLDFTIPGGGVGGKAVHVRVNSPIADLSRYGIGVANNGGGTDGQEYTFPAAAPAVGDDILVVRDSQAMADYFDACFSEFEHVFVDTAGVISQNGDDAIELFMDSMNIETYGDVNVDGSGEPWEYTDSWAYKDATGNWTTGGLDCTDGSTTTYNSNCPYPLCPALPPATKFVTFQVDVSQFTGGSFTTVNLNGDFNGWCGGCNPMTDANGDGIWEVTLPLTQDSIEYKFTMDGWTIQENFTPGDPCTKTTGGFTNRFVVLTADTTLPVVCWEQCGPCPTISYPLALQGIIDFTVPEGGAAGKAVHVRVTDPIADLSAYGIGVANNGGGTDGQEYTFPAAAPAVGDDILVVRDSQALANYFDICFTEFEHVFVDLAGVISQNGDDAIELFKDSLVIETYGDADVDGTGEPWEYSDAWAYKDSAGIWFTGALDCTDSSLTTLTSACPYPMCIGLQPVLVTAIAVQGQGGVSTINVAGGQLQMEATITPANASNQDVTWSVDNAAIATIDANGLLEANTDGVVTVTATAADGSGVSGSAAITISNQSTSIGTLLEGWQVYPNPATTHFTVDVAGQEAVVRLFSATGQLMRTQRINGQGVVSLAGMASGMYLLDIQTGEVARQVMISKQ